MFSRGLDGKVHGPCNGNLAVVGIMSWQASGIYLQRHVALSRASLIESHVDYKG